MIPKPTFWREGGPTHHSRPSWLPPPQTSPSGPGLGGICIGLLLVALPLGTTPLEIANGIAIAGALWTLRAGRVDPGPLAGPALVVAVGSLLMALQPGADPLEALSRFWALAPVWTVPILLTVCGPLPWRHALLPAAAAAVVAVAQLGIAFATGDVHETVASGLFSHHLTLAYALLPAFGYAVAIRSPVALLLAAGILATRSVGGAAAVVTVAVVAVTDRRIAALAPVAAVAALAGWPAGLLQRGILWAGGASIAARGGVPVEQFRAVVDAEHRALDPSFQFPFHAHDSWLQLAAQAGVGVWIGVAWAAAVLFRWAPRWLVGVAAGFAVGGLTQDLPGDLEVLRAACVWAPLALAGVLEPADDVAVE